MAIADRNVHVPHQRKTVNAKKARWCKEAV
jgi:hypothetical protein